MSLWLIVDSYRQIYEELYFKESKLNKKKNNKQINKQTKNTNRNRRIFWGSNLGIRWLYSQQKAFLDSKQHLMVKLQSWRFGERTLSLLLLPGLLWPLWVPSIGQIDLENVLFHCCYSQVYSDLFGSHLLVK